MWAVVLCNKIYPIVGLIKAKPLVGAIVANWDNTQVLIKATMEPVPTGEFSSLQFHCSRIIRTKI